MFSNSNNDNDTEFREVHLVNLIKQNYGDEGFYSGEETYLTDEEHSEPVGTEEGKDEELHRDEPETSGTVQTIEVSTSVPPVDSTVLSNRNSQSHQSPQSTITSSSTYT
jgi:hypothetical protein